MPRLGDRKLYYKLQVELSELNVGRDKLFRILRANHMLIQPKRSYHITTDSHHRFRKHKNIVSNIEIDKPEQVWVSDITYVGTRANPSYLALVTDAYSKRIMGYDVSNRPCHGGFTQRSGNGSWQQALREPTADTPFGQGTSILLQRLPSAAG